MTGTHPRTSGHRFVDPVPRLPGTPIRRSELIAIASAIRELYSGLSIEEVAECEEVILVKVAGGKEGGFAFTEIARRPMFIESLARPGSPIKVLGRWIEYERKVIVMNPVSGIPEREIFWHEFYHLFYSPRGIQRAESFQEHYGLLSVPHLQEERRANEFAASILVPSIAGLDSISKISEAYCVSERLATHAVELYSSFRR